MLRRKPGGKRDQRLHRLQQIAHRTAVERGDVRAAKPVECDDPRRRQMLERLAQRATADAEAPGQVRLHEVLAGDEYARSDAPDNRFGDFVRRAAADAIEGVVGAGGKGSRCICDHIGRRLPCLQNINPGVPLP